jgi:hypothetical protein
LDGRGVAVAHRCSMKMYSSTDSRHIQQLFKLAHTRVEPLFGTLLKENLQPPRLHRSKSRNVRTDIFR